MYYALPFRGEEILLGEVIVEVFLFDDVKTDVLGELVSCDFLVLHRGEDVTSFLLELTWWG